VLGLFDAVIAFGAPPEQALTASDRALVTA
jgi:hypothetical protein